MLQYVSLAVPVRQPQDGCPVKAEIALGIHSLCVIAGRENVETSSSKAPEDILDNLDLVECLAGLEQPGVAW